MRCALVVHALCIVEIGGHSGENSGKVARLTGLEPATSGVTGRHSNQLGYNRAFAFRRDQMARISAVARLTGLEPATSGVTGRHSNQLSYNRPLTARNKSKREPRSRAQAAARQATKHAFSWFHT